jgi:predicted GTPase
MIGATGVGKSSTINCFIDNGKKVAIEGGDPESVTTEVKSFNFESDYHKTYCLLDTQGTGDSNSRDAEFRN